MRGIDRGLRQENGTIFSSFLVHSELTQRTRAKPKWRSPQRRNLSSRVRTRGEERAVGLAESVVPDAEHLLHGVLDDVFEVVGGRSGAVAR